MARCIYPRCSATWQRDSATNSFNPTVDSPADWWRFTSVARRVTQHLPLSCRDPQIWKRSILLLPYMLIMIERFSVTPFPILYNDLSPAIPMISNPSLPPKTRTPLAFNPYSSYPNSPKYYNPSNKTLIIPIQVQ